jgi:FkbM family methyltransferase
MSSDEYQATKAQSGRQVPVQMNGYVVFARPADHLIGASVIASASYESHVIERFASALHSGAYVLDVGANIGLYTMKAAAIVGKQGRVVAVEPLPQNHSALYAGIIGNEYSNVEVLPFAASDKPGLAAVICAPDSSNGIICADGGSRSEKSFVPTHRLDDVLSTLPRLDVVKIDIEGHEPLAWRGMTSLLERHRPCIFSEFSPIAMRNVGQSAEDYLRLLFVYAPTVSVLHRDADAVDCANADAVMEEWRQANHRAKLGGEMHLDLFLSGQRA